MHVKKISSSLFYLVALSMTAKLFVDTAGQYFKPYLAVTAEGLGIDIVKMGRIVALSSFMGFTAPLMGHLADRVGYRFVLRLCLVLTGLGLLIIPIIDTPQVMIPAMILVGFGFAGFAPNLHAYLSTKTPYEKRARGIATLEYSWALAGIVGLFFSGYLIEAYSWKTPFYVIGPALLAWYFIFLLLPKDRGMSVHHLHKTGNNTAISLFKKLKQFFDLGENKVSAWGNIILPAFNFFAINNIMIIHGAWLQAEYNVGPAGIGKVALLIGIFDLAACFVVAVAGDRIGKRKSVLIGVIGAMAACVIFPFLNFSLPSALVGLVLIRVFFEFATVSNFPLLTEQVPDQRGKVMGLSIMLGYGGGAVAQMTGPATYLRFGIWAIAPISFGALAVSFFLLLFVIKEGEKKVLKR